LALLDIIQSTSKDEDDNDGTLVLGDDGQYKPIGLSNSSVDRLTVVRQINSDIDQRIAEQGATPSLRLVQSIIRQILLDPTREDNGLTAENVCRFLPGDLYSESIMT
jgi:hypothetical protein